MQGPGGFLPLEQISDNQVVLESAGFTSFSGASSLGQKRPGFKTASPLMLLLGQARNFLMGDLVLQTASAGTGRQ